jgi:hypothetical protein
MKSVTWKDITELIALSAILASVVFVGLQLKQAEEIARSEIQFSILNTQIEVNNAINADPEIWARGIAGESLEPTEAIVFSRQVANVNNLFYSTVQFSRLMGLDFEDTDVSEYAAFLYENPGARQVWRAHEEHLKKYRGLGDPGETYTSDWVDAIESKFSIFDQALEQ